LASVGKGDPSAHLRPTTDRVRENLFNVLASGRFGNPLENAQVLDLFAGTGALGFEALSRGAERLWLIDNALPPCPGAPFDLVFLDPPYGKDLGQNVVPKARAKGWIADDALIIWEEQGEMLAPEGFCSLECLRYGDTEIYDYFIHMLQKLKWSNPDGSNLIRIFSIPARCLTKAS